jgi:hypothetical protein
LRISSKHEKDLKLRAEVAELALKDVKEKVNEMC